MSSQAGFVVTMIQQIMRRHNTGLVCRRLEKIMRSHNTGLDCCCHIYIFGTCLVFLLGLLSVVFIAVPLGPVERPRALDLCNYILLNSGSPAVIDLPPFNASYLQIQLPDRNYFLDYQEGVDDNGNPTFTVCVNNSIKLDLVCMSFDARKTAICRPSDYPQCLPAAFDSGREGSNPAFGVSIINVESNVTVYHIKALDPSKVYSETLTWPDSNDLNSTWFAGLSHGWDCFSSDSLLVVDGIVIGGCTMLCLVLCLLLPFCVLHFLRMRRRRRRPQLHSMVESSAAQEQPQQPRSDTMSLEQTRPLEPDTLHPPRLTPALIPSAAASLEDSGKPIRSIQEVQLDNLCWIPFGMDSFKLFKSDRKEGSFSFIPVRNLTSHLYTSSKDKEEILLEWSEEHLTPNALTTVTYAVIADGPFDLPPGFPKRCSMVVYVVTEGDGLKEPLCLHLPHWSKFEDSSSLTCLRAPHTLAPGHTHYSFKELDKESYKIHPNKCIVKVDGRNCLFAIAGQQGVLDDYQYQVLERKLSICEKELRIFITFGTGTWRKIVCNFCKGSEETEWDTSYEIPWTIDRDSDVLRSTLRPASQGQGWTVSVSGLNALRVERLDFRNKSSIRHADSLKEAVEERYYPHAFRYRVVQNEVPPGANTRIVATNIVLEPTHPGPVTIPLSMVEHDSGQARPKVDFKPPVALQRSTPDK